MKAWDNKQQREAVFSKAFYTADCPLIVNMRGFWSDDAASHWFENCFQDRTQYHNMSFLNFV